MSGPNFDVSGLRFWSGYPGKLNTERWEQIQAVGADSLSQELSQEEVNYLVHNGDVVRFAAGRIDPQVDVKDGRLLEGQDFKNIRIAVAIDEGDDNIVGYSYSADNTSGNYGFVRWAKMSAPPDRKIPLIGHKRYVWEREIMVRQNYQGNGLAHTLGYITLSERLPNQPVSIYEFDPDDLAVRSLTRLGFRKTGSRPSKPFGKSGREVDLVRFQADRSEDVMRNIITIDDSAEDAISTALQSVKSHH